MRLGPPTPRDTRYPTETEAVRPLPTGDLLSQDRAATVPYPPAPSLTNVLRSP
jgi:hypothetical protein